MIETIKTISSTASNVTVNNEPKSHFNFPKSKSVFKSVEKTKIENSNTGETKSIK